MGGKNGGLCAREKITGSSEETFISMRKDREITKNNTSHMSTHFCLVWLLTYMRGLSPITLYICTRDRHPWEILRAWEECGRGKICGLKATTAEIMGARHLPGNWEKLQCSGCRTRIVEDPNREDLSLSKMRDRLMCEAYCR